MISTAEHRVHSLQLRECGHHLAKIASRLAGIGWFVLALLLFIVMGPFAAPIALWVVFTSVQEDQSQPVSVVDETR